MSIRRGLLALLAQEPMYGARLRSEFESRTGGTWPLNVGQVYTTLDRLERDGLVEGAGGADAEGRIAYRLTDPGEAEVRRWWDAPVDRGDTPRDELVIKLALAVTVPGMRVMRAALELATSTVAVAVVKRAERASRSRLISCLAISSFGRSISYRSPPPLPEDVLTRGAGQPASCSHASISSRVASAAARSASVADIPAMPAGLTASTSMRMMRRLVILGSAVVLPTARARRLRGRPSSAGNEGSTGFMVRYTPEA